MSAIENLIINFNSEGWGPINGDKLTVIEEVPYAHFDKKDRCGRPADFIQHTNAPQSRPDGRRRRDDYLPNTDFSYRHDANEDSTFQLVDTSKTQSRSKHSSN